MIQFSVEVKRRLEFMTVLADNWMYGEVCFISRRGLEELLKVHVKFIIVANNLWNYQN